MLYWWMNGRIDRYVYIYIFKKTLKIFDKKYIPSRSNLTLDTWAKTVIIYIENYRQEIVIIVVICIKSRGTNDK